MKLLIAVGLLALYCAAPASAQTVLAPGQPVSVGWDAPAVTGPENAVAGYRFETFTESATGVVITTTNVPLNPTTATLPSSALPQTGAFLLAVRAVGTTGILSARSNALPFVRPETPGAPVNLRLVVVP